MCYYFHSIASPTLIPIMQSFHILVCIAHIYVMLGNPKP